MPGIQIAVIAFAIVMVFATYTAWRKDQLSPRESLIWSGVWVGLILISLFPDRLRGVIGPLHVARLLDLVIVLAILFLSALTFALNRALRQTQLRIVQLVRSIALDEAKTPPPKL